MKVDLQDRGSNLSVPSNRNIYGNNFVNNQGNYVQNNDPNIMIKLNGMNVSFNNGLDMSPVVGAPNNGLPPTPPPPLPPNQVPPTPPAPDAPNDNHNDEYYEDEYEEYEEEQ